MDRDELVRYLDGYLKVGEIDDDSRNGLQVEGRPEVRHVALAVDACLAAFQQAARVGADLLIVHHGLFWQTYHPLAGAFLRRIRALLEGGVSLYAAHLPLDAHPEVGNNVCLARLLGLEVVAPFGTYHGVTIGLEARPAGPLTAQELARQLQERLGVPVTLQAYGPPLVRRVGIVSGGGAEMIRQAAEQGLDLFLTGERSHAFFHEAEERGIHVLYAGHYATEAPGLRALGEHLSERFGLAMTFLDLPTGL
ncbi:MAG: Nif3-like dinuclear metal center hexameric protein [Chloroflexia bacterium]